MSKAWINGSHGANPSRAWVVEYYDVCTEEFDSRLTDHLSKVQLVTGSFGSNFRQHVPCRFYGVKLGGRLTKTKSIEWRLYGSTSDKVKQFLKGRERYRSNDYIVLLVFDHEIVLNRDDNFESVYCPELAHPFADTTPIGHLKGHYSALTPQEAIAKKKYDALQRDITDMQSQMEQLVEQGQASGAQLFGEKDLFP